MFTDYLTKTKGNTETNYTREAAGLTAHRGNIGTGTDNHKGGKHDKDRK